MSLCHKFDENMKGATSYWLPKQRSAFVCFAKFLLYCNCTRHCSIANHVASWVKTQKNISQPSSSTEFDGSDGTRRLSFVNALANHSCSFDLSFWRDADLARWTSIWWPAKDQILEKTKWLQKTSMLNSYAHSAIPTAHFVSKKNTVLGPDSPPRRTSSPATRLDRSGYWLAG